MYVLLGKVSRLDNGGHILFGYYKPFGERIPISYTEKLTAAKPVHLSDSYPIFAHQVPTFAVRETDVSRYNGGTRVPPLNPSESIVLSEHYRL